MPQTLALLHTSPSLCPMFTQLCGEVMPHVRLLHFVDESLIKNTIAAGHLEKLTMRRTLALASSAVDAGADAVLVTCSSIGAAADLAAQLHDRPILRVDSAMAQAAVAHGPRIGVLATLPTTLTPTVDLVWRSAVNAGLAPDVRAHLCEGAFDAVMRGDGATHDALVAHALLHAMQGVDAIVLAQASMARVLAAIDPADLPAPVYSSPRMGVDHAAQVLAGLAH